jgi:hypothetical protein
VIRVAVLIAVALVLLAGVPQVESCAARRTVVVGPATAAVYVYEKDSGPVPAGVTVALDRLNRDRRIVATLLEDDTTNGSGAVPDQYRAALEAARKAGLPAVVALAGQTVLRVTPKPASEAAVMEAVP